jgi:hypothetical protein
MGATKLNSHVAVKLPAEAITVLPELKDSAFAEERTLHKVRYAQDSW